MTEERNQMQSETYHDPTSWATLGCSWNADNYPEAMTEVLVEAFAALEGWAVPLAFALAFRPVDGHSDKSLPITLLLADELTDGVQLPADWRTWAEATSVEAITGEAVREVVHLRLDALREEYGRPFDLFGTRFMACRFAIGPASLPDEFVLSSWGGTELRSVHTTVADGKRWISEPQTDETLLLPVGLEITGTHASGHSLQFSMDPNWSYFGDKDSPGWPTIAAAADRLLAISDRWSVTLLKPGDPATR